MAKILRRLLITLAIVAALVVVGDRVLNAVAESRIADRAAQTAAEHGAYSDQRPDVTIHGWPFLTQAVGGEFTQIDITLADVGAEGLTFPELALVAHDVDTSDMLGGGSVVARTVDVSGQVATSAVEELMRERTGQDFSLDTDGTGSLTTTVEALGFEVEVMVTGVIEVGDGTVRFVPEAVEALTGDVPAGAEPYLEEARSALSTEFALPELPWGVQLTDIEFGEDVIEISGSAEDVELS